MLEGFRTVSKAAAILVLLCLMITAARTVTLWLETLRIITGLLPCFAYHQLTVLTALNLPTSIAPGAAICPLTVLFESMSPACSAAARTEQGRGRLPRQLQHATRGRSPVTQARKGSLAAGAEVDQVEGLAAPEGNHDAVAAAEHAGPCAWDEGRGVLVLHIVQAASLGLGGKVAVEPQAPEPLRQVLFRQLQGSGCRFRRPSARDTQPSSNVHG